MACGGMLIESTPEAEAELKTVRRFLCFCAEYTQVKSCSNRFEVGNKGQLPGWLNASELLAPCMYKAVL